MENIEITLKSGIKVTVESFHLNKTYGGVICGQPSKKMNQDIIDTIKYPSNWGSRKSILKSNNIYSDSNSLLIKDFTCNVWLSSLETIDDKSNWFDGSQIIVTFFVKSISDRTLEEIIKTEIFELDWILNAENYEL